MRSFETHCQRIKYFKSRMVLGPMIVIVASFLFSCNFLSVDIPPNKVTGSQVFANDKSANSALIGIYLDLYSAGSFAAGGTDGLVSLAGLSADELVNGIQRDVNAIQFQDTDISPKNSYVLSTWTSMYRAIFQSNSVLEGLKSASSISRAKKNQLNGEALFIRAFCYFYLVNFFGDVPLTTTTNYETNGIISRTPADQVYQQIKNDLTEAESLLSSDYVEGQRIRPNRYAVQALLARVYLFTGDWARAEDKATSVISSSQYSLINLDKVFLANSQEAIWQIKPPDVATCTIEGQTFGTNVGIKNNVLNRKLVDSFEPNDARKTNWVTDVVSGADTFFLPFKYRKQDFETPTNEYSMVLRVAEQYLIRAEARAHQGKLQAAIIDVDKLRARADLTLLQNTNPGISQDRLVSAILNEKKIELMVEWGSRWLDLKRSDLATSVLSPIKKGWSSTDELYPIPESEILNDLNLSPQNEGY